MDSDESPSAQCGGSRLASHWRLTRLREICYDRPISGGFGFLVMMVPKRPACSLGVSLCGLAQLSLCLGDRAHEELGDLFHLRFVLRLLERLDQLVKLQREFFR